ncbi:Uma2 family endonuclease [Vacuolonema iberomarrocanum]|uniref:Uma2 family endonuclease n=1 Tax=Vacuolonema iberomarrocanum TaxID=3454632 RepID=UPI0019F1D156|nr:Uma2 family endonuclease [filamentous cyanobacterium LEGE 07170]
MTTQPLPFVPHGTPPLESGDRLTRSEFERRYAGAAQIQKAELIEGRVFVASPLRFRQHSEPHSRLHGWLWTYQIATPGSRLGIKLTVRLDLDNEPQPDIVLLIDTACGGRVQITGDDYLEGAPELVIEIAASSAAIDLGDKMQAYRRNGVQEYLVWQAFENQLDWFQLVDGNYQTLLPDEDGIIRSRQFPGLWLAIAPFRQGDMTQVLAILQQGIVSSAHQAFVEQLQQALQDNAT